MAMRESASGGSRMTAESSERTDHPDGSVNLTPEDVDRGVSAAIRSGTGFGWAGGAGAGGAVATGGGFGAGAEAQAQSRTARTDRRMGPSLSSLRQQVPYLRRSCNPTAGRQTIISTWRPASPAHFGDPDSSPAPARADPPAA